MALALQDRVKETTTVTGTGTATLLGATTGFQSFAVVGNANTTYYCIADQGGANWEVGIGTYTASGTTLARTTVLSSSNAGSLVAFTAGIKDVFVTYPSSKGLWKDASGNAIGLGTPAAFVGTNITGTASGLTAGNVTTNANLTGAVTSTGNATSLGSFTSAQLATALTDETGSGSAVFATSPTLVTPVLGTPASGVVTNLTGTASININGTVGATTATTGAFTTLSASSTVTLSGGTANGVAYLNASKVLTSGSGLVFDGTTLNFGGTAQRITGDFSNATITNKLSFQSSTTNGGSYPQVLPNGTNTNSGFLAFNNADPTNAGYLGLLSTSTDARVTSGITGTGTYLPITFYTSGSEKVRIDTSGNVGIGTTAPAANIRLSLIEGTNTAPYQLRLGHNNTGYSYDIGRSTSTGLLAFYGNQTSATGYIFGGVDGERMRIDSSGNVLVGTTFFPSSSSKMLVSGDLNATYTNGVIQGQSKTAGDVSYPALYLSKFDNNSTTSQVLVRFAIGNYAAGQGQINANGVNAAAFGSFSDSRLKENITDLPSQLNNILALRPVEFDFIESEGGGHQIGFIAQEVQEIYPDLVGERTDGMLTLSDMNKNDARLIKAIQEQQTLIEALTARLTALEAK
jgi:hypothetical protein